MQDESLSIVNIQSPIHRQGTTEQRRLVFFYPTRFHLFDQLDTQAFSNEEFKIYSIYPPRYFRVGRFEALAPRNHTLWGALGLRGFMALAAHLRAPAAIIRLLRGWYLRTAAAEFSWRTRNTPPAVVVASAGYLGDRLDLLRRAGHRVVSNHGSLYEPWVHAQMAALGEAARDQTANWAHAELVARMDREFETADSILLCSPTARDSFPERFRARVRVVPLGAPQWGETAALPTRGTVYLHVSNLSFSKNCTAIVDAFDRIRCPGDQLVLVGPLPQDPVLRRRLDAPSSGVEWRGRQDRAGVAAAMAEADIFVHPSFADGWGMVITEALATGLPVIASPQTGAASYYAPSNPKTVTLVDPTDTGAIAMAMREMSKRLAETPELMPQPPMSWNDSAEVLRDALEPLRDAAPTPDAPA